MRKRWNTTTRTPACLTTSGSSTWRCPKRCAPTATPRRRRSCRQKALDALKKANELKPDQISSTYFLAKLLHEDGEDAKARDLLDHVLKIPFSAMMQVSREEVEALRREVG